MPNTIAHLGIHALATKALIRKAEIKWIWAGCVIPDLPWIGQRAAGLLMPGLSPYDVRLYAIAQATLLMCLAVSAALALCSTRPWRVFAILALGCVLHLLLDALQIKWANGVHLFAPLSWDLLNFGLFWPEDWPSLALTLLGLSYAVYAWVMLPDGSEDLERPRGVRLVAISGLLAAYLLVPFALSDGARDADNHYVATLQNVEDRTDRSIALDRNRFVRDDKGDWVQVWTGERIAATGLLPEQSTKASIRGTFSDPATVHIIAFHRHPGSLRDLASYVGLALVLAWWIRSTNFRRRRSDPSKAP